MSKFSSQDLASYAAVVVACVALYVGWDQARIGRNQQHADVFPVVQLSSLYVVEEVEGQKVRHLRLMASNPGVGPAFIESAKWQFGEHQIERLSQLADTFPKGLEPLQNFTGSVDNILLGAGVEQLVWDVYFANDEATNQLLDGYMQDFWQMDLQVCYCSLYERCWVSQYNAASARPKAVNSCPVE